MAARIFCLLGLLFSAKASDAQQSDSTLRGLFSIGLSAQKGFIFAHSTDVENTAGSYPWSIQLDLNWHLRDQHTWDHCYFYPRTGFSIQYVNYNNWVLGHGVNLLTYIEPYFNYRSRLTFSFKGSMGLAFLSNPFDSVTNPGNRSYSMAVSGALTGGLGIHYRASPHLNLHVYANYNHVSNGGVKLPNKGINWPGMSVGADYSIESHYFPVRERGRYKHYKDIPMRMEAGAYYSSVTVEEYEYDRYSIAGAYMQASKAVSVINALNGGLEIWKDDALEERMRRKSISGKSNVRSGILFGNEFLMGKLTFSQQIGYYLYNPSGLYPSFYQRYGFMYHTNYHISFGFNLLAHTNTANFLDLRLAWSSWK